MSCRITLLHVIAASRAVQKLMEASYLFHLEPLPNGRFEIACAREAVPCIRALAALDDGHPVINWDAPPVDRITGFCVSIPGVEKRDVVGRLLARSERFSFDGYTDFEVEVQSLEVFDYAKIQWIRLTLGAQVVAGPVPRTVCMEEVVG